MLVDLAGADPDRLAQMLRDTFGRGERQVQVKPMTPRSHRVTMFRIPQYMTKARYTSVVGERHIWLRNEDIVAMALWRDNLPLQWHRFTWGIQRCTQDEDDRRSRPQAAHRPLAHGHHRRSSAWRRVAASSLIAS
jgi:hypothetical protein